MPDATILTLHWGSGSLEVVAEKFFPLPQAKLKIFLNMLRMAWYKAEVEKILDWLEHTALPYYEGLDQTDHPAPLKTKQTRQNIAEVRKFYEHWHF